MSLSETDDPIEMIRQSGADPQVLGRIWNHYRDRLRRVVRLRLDRRLQGRADPSDVLQEAFLDFQSRAAEYVQKPDMPFFLWLRFLTGQRLQLVHRQHLGTQMRDVGGEVSLHRGAMPQATSVWRDEGRGEGVRRPVRRRPRGRRQDRLGPPSELNEPDFDAVRGRADFQRLVAEVEAQAEKK
jgi:hypothetical protein